MTAAALTAPRRGAAPDAALPIPRRSGRMLVVLERWPSSPAAVRWAARHARQLIVATAPRPLPERDRDRGPLGNDHKRLARELLSAARQEPALGTCAWVPAIADGSSPAEALAQCARMHACEAIVIGAPDGDHDVPDELLRIAEVPVIVVPRRGHPLEDWS